MYRYDDTGRMTSSSTMREPEFDSDQIDLLLAWHAFKKDLGGHGQMLSEAASADADPNGSGTLRFSARGPFWDWAEKARLDAVDAYRKGFGKDDPPNLNGAYWVVDRNEYGPRPD